MVAVSGNRLVNTAGATVRLKGATYSGYEFAGIQGFWPNDSSGAQAGQSFGPNIAAMAAWNLNSVRIPINQAQWLGQITYDTVGNLHDADPRRRYRQDIIQQVDDATAAGFAVILVLHWSAPSNLAPMGLQLAADADNSPRFWTSVGDTFKTYPNVMCELHNEPILQYAIQSGGTSWQVLKSGGVMTYAECTSNNGSFRKVFAMSISGALGEFRPRSVIADGAVTAIVTYHDMARNRLYFHVNGTQIDTPPAFTVGHAITTLTRATKPMIGRGIPATSLSGTAANAVDGNYNTSWRTSGALTPIEFDISGIVPGIAQPIAGSRPMLVGWYSEDTYPFDTSRQPDTAYNRPRDYTVEFNASASGPSGWVVVKTVTGNTYTSRMHLVNAFGYARWRFNPATVDGSAGNSDCRAQFDMWDASDTITGTFGNGVGTAVTDGFFFVGDSITAGSQDHGDISGIPTPAFGDTVFATTGHRPPSRNGGQPFWKASNWLADDGTGSGLTVLENYLQTCPLKYVVLAIGANDAGGTASPVTPAATYVANMLALAAKVALYGKVAIIPTITFSTNVTRNTGVQALNAAMAVALAAHPEIMVGADQYAYFQANPTLISSADNLHPTAQGYSDLRTIVWGGWATVLYSASATIVAPSVGWQTAGTQAMLDAVRLNATLPVIVPGVNYSNDMSQWLASVPTDPLNQIVAGWHAYPPIQKINTATLQAGGLGHAVNDIITLPQPSSVYTPARVTVTSIGAGGAVTGFTFATDVHRGEYLQNHLPANPIAQASTTGSGTGLSLNVTTWANRSAQWSMPVNWPTMQTIAASYPVVITETGEHSYAGLTGSPWMADLLGWADAYGASALGWTWDAWTWNPGDDVLIKDVNGTPTDGYGVAFQAWALGPQVKTVDTRLFAPYVKAVAPTRAGNVGDQVTINFAAYIAGATNQGSTIGNPQWTATLPAGLTIDPSTGVAAGTLTTAQSLTASVTCTNSSGSKTINFAYVVAAGATIDIVLPDFLAPLGQQVVYDLTQYMTIPTGYAYTSLAMSAGTLPAGWALSSAFPPTLTAAASGRTAVNVTGLKMTLTADSVAVSLVTTFALTSVPGGTLLPFTIGHPFKQGDVPSGSYVTSPLADFQADVRNRWSDGSWKFAVLSGKQTLAAAGSAVVTIQKTTTPPTGSNIAEPSAASYQAGGANPISVTLTGVGAGAYDPSAARTAGITAWNRATPRKMREFLGPVMSEFHYYAPTSDTQLTIWWYVRVYSDRMEVETAIEQGWTRAGVSSPANKTYSWSITVGGVTFSGTNLNHRHHARWSRRDWISTDPQITPAHDATYLKSTKLVPNYMAITCATTNAAGPGGSSASGENIGLANYAQSAAPMTRANFDADMTAVGVHAALGLLSEWDAAYVISGDKRAFNGMLANEQASNCVDVGAAGGSSFGAGFVQRDETTGLPACPLDYSAFDYNNTANLPAGSGSVFVTDTPHSWNIGYLTYLTTGRWFSLESMQFHTAANFLTVSAGTTNRLLNQNQDRGAAWMVRTMASAVAMTPDSHPKRASYVTWMGSNISAWKTAEVGFNNLGIRKNVFDHTDQLAGFFGYRDFMNNFLTQCFAFANDIVGDALATTPKADMLATAQFHCLLATGKAGLHSAGGWSYRQAASYNYLCGASFPTFYVDFNTSYNANGANGFLTGGVLTDAAGQALQGGNFPNATSYWGNYLPGLAYACDLGVAGAVAGYARMTGASNWSTWLVPTEIGRGPQWAIQPR